MLREEIRKNELANKLVVSEDFRKAVIILKVAKGITDEEVITTIQQNLEEFPGSEKIYKGGTPYLRAQVNSDISKDMFILMPLGLLIMIFFLFLAFCEIGGDLTIAGCNDVYCYFFGILSINGLGIEHHYHTGSHYDDCHCQ